MFKDEEQEAREARGPGPATRLRVGYLGTEPPAPRVSERGAPEAPASKSEQTSQAADSMFKDHLAGQQEAGLSGGGGQREEEGERWSDHR